jgi:sigma-B regulation protein RsbU (phosphoserine phosphatase)
MQPPETQARPSVLHEEVPDPQRLMAVLQFLAELGQMVASNTELQPILDWIVSKTTAMFNADEGSIRLIDPAADAPTGGTYVKKFASEQGSGSWPRAVATSVIGYLLHEADHLASPDLANDPRFAGLRNVESRVRSILAAPLRVENHVTGVLAVTQAKPGRQFNAGDLQLLRIVAGHSAEVIERARLRAIEVETQRLEEEQARARKEQAQAREIQMSFVPSRPLQVGGREILGRVIPAGEVGGDAFDYFMVEGGRVGFAISDVAGKGLPAALLMASAAASLRAFCDGRLDLPTAIGHVNQSVVRAVHGAMGRFVTLFYGEWDPATGVLTYTNAGHNPPFLLREDGSVQELAEGGVPLGLFEDRGYNEGRVSLAPGEALLLYSDGITEAVDLARREFGEERLRTLWKQRAREAPELVIRSVFEDVQRFRGAAAQSDDMTVVVLGPQNRG